MPVLKFLSDNKEVVFPLTANSVSIGRGGQADLRLQDNNSSRLHCQLRKSTDGYEVVDLESRNGTSVNGQTVKDALLKNGDVIVVGSSRLTYLEEEAAPTPEAVKALAEAEPSPDKTLAGPPPKKAPPKVQTKPAGDDVQLVKELRKGREAILNELGKIIVGQKEIVDQVLLALLAKGHCLLIGVPGLAKTLLVSCLASVLDLRFRRIQFTPDLMPSDITGTRVIEEDQTTGKREFRFVKGPIFANILLADEINRTPPKTQAALLEAMQEKRVTVGGVTYELEEPFLVLATQNPIEQEGTYPLPEAQLDRFMFSVALDYPKDEEEVQIYQSTTSSSSPDLDIVISEDQLLQFQRIVRKVPLSEHVAAYVQEIVRTTRPARPNVPEFIREYVAWGAGPRAGQNIILGAKTRAICNGRFNVLVEDVKAVCPPVLRHRVLVNFNAQAEGIDSDEIVKRILETCKEPK